MPACSVSYFFIRLATPTHPMAVPHPVHLIQATRRPGQLSRQRLAKGLAECPCEVIYTTYRIAEISMTFCVLEGHSSIASLFKWDVS